jgi:hypothetical protein
MMLGILGVLDARQLSGLEISVAIQLHLVREIALIISISK